MRPCCGSVIIETVFSRARHRQVGQRCHLRPDYAVVQYGAVFAVLVLVINLITDTLFLPGSPGQSVKGARYE